MAEAWAVAVRFAVHSLAHTYPPGMAAVLDAVIQPPPQGRALLVHCFYLGAECSLQPALFFLLVLLPAVHSHNPVAGCIYLL